MQTKSDIPGPARKESETEAGDFFAKIKKSLRSYSIQSELIERGIHFGDSIHPIKAHFGSETLYQYLSRAWKHLPAHPSLSDKALDLYFLDEATTDYQLPPLPFNLKEVGLQGIFPAYFNEAEKAVWQFGSRVLYLYDRNRNYCLFWTRDVRELPNWELSFPLRYPVMWGSETTDAIMLHAAAVGNQNGAALLVGKSGSGKSTTSLSALASGMQFLGEDYVLVNAGDPIEVYSLFCSAKARSSTFEQLNINDGQTFPLNIEENSRRLTYLDENYADQLVDKLPVRTLLLPSVDHSDQPHFSPMTTGELLTALAPSCLFQIPCNRPAALKKITQLVKRLPCYRFHLSTDLQRNADCLNQFLLKL
ncbi:hypothetical protein [Rubellicoccus peritrichatus]|uniref:Serine kinase n=1 Tax=Rubellicoccus peritrichatus TaxID=3080537 RepID=A0AAQ3LEY8_9BACT|nr:hypothetical protein [Puniceicoccus sp. CR14]WOO42685.1 hypothetical protein RZN69_06240 [Puniceicoccus sp. CR14]